VIAILPIGLLISYLKLGTLFDESVKELFFPDVKLQLYLLFAAFGTTCIYLLAILFVRKIKMTEAH